MATHRLELAVTALWLITAMVVGGTGSAPAQVGQGAPGDNPLERHRQRAAGGPQTAPAVEGRITGVGEGRIVTDLSSSDLLAADIEEGTRVSVRIQGKALLARIVSGGTYQRLIEDEDARDGLDVDVVGVADGEAPVVIVGLYGDLGESLRVRPGMPVVVQKGRASDAGRRGGRTP
jgi:hypothetical protein